MLLSASVDFGAGRRIETLIRCAWNGGKAISPRTKKARQLPGLLITIMLKDLSPARRELRYPL